MAAESVHEIHTVLPKNFAAGPHGLGDPNDTSLRKVEREILVPMKMRDKAKHEKCIEEVAGFEKCCKSTGVLMVLRCRKENSALIECLEKWYQDEGFKQECTKEYISERSEFRRTGVRQSQKKKDASTF